LIHWSPQLSIFGPLALKSCCLVAKLAHAEVDIVL
jgi:hypothetical protein